MTTATNSMIDLAALYSMTIDSAALYSMTIDSAALYSIANLMRLTSSTSNLTTAVIELAKMVAIARVAKTSVELSSRGLVLLDSGRSEASVSGCSETAEGVNSVRFDRGGRIARACDLPVGYPPDRGDGQSANLRDGRFQCFGLAWRPAVLHLDDGLVDGGRLSALD